MIAIALSVLLAAVAVAPSADAPTDDGVAQATQDNTSVAPQVLQQDPVDQEILIKNAVSAPPVNERVSKRVGGQASKAEATGDEAATTVAVTAGSVFALSQMLRELTKDSDEAPAPISP